MEHPTSMRRTVHTGRLVAPVAALALVAGVFSGPVAHAATVYELEGAWTSGTPAAVESGEPLAAHWWFNLNDDAPAPGNAPIPDVTIRFTAQNAHFTELPEVCLTAGSPASSISADRSTLVCNVGTRDEGTAELLVGGLVAYGPPGASVLLTAQLADRSRTLSPIPIVGSFAMDLKIDSGSPQVLYDGTRRHVLVPFALRHAVGTEAGEDTLSFEIDVAVTDPTAVLSLDAPDTCIPQDRAQPEYPYSASGHAPEQTAAFPACSLTLIAPDRVELTLSGLDYTVAAPVTDSVGVALPSRWNVVAAGQFVLTITPASGDEVRVFPTVATRSYVSVPGGASSTDDPGNNTSSAVIIDGSWTGGWFPSWQLPPGIGGPWDASTRSMVGKRMLTLAGARAPLTSDVGLCAIYDTRYVTFAEAAVGLPHPEEDTVVPAPGVAYEYYVGDGPGGILDPESVDYEPNDFRCDDPDPGWVSTLPAEPSTIRAVRATATPATTAALPGHNMVYLISYVTIDAGTPVGQDVWFWMAFAGDGVTWQHPHRQTSWDPSYGGQETPGLRYPYTFAGRDVLRTLAALPVISKTVDQPVATAGATVDYTITAIPEAALTGVNPLLTVVDTLPAGMQYVPGSASPAPTSVSTVVDPAGTREVLTWEFPNGATNEAVTILFSATIPTGAAPGELFANEASATIEDATRFADAETRVQDGGFTSLRKTVASAVVPQLGGVASNSWTVTLSSFDGVDQAFTDTIDLLPYDGDGRGTHFTGGYELAGPVDVSGMTTGATVYYTSDAPASIVEDPAAPENGAAGDPTGATTAWSTVFDAQATAVRVIGGPLPAAAIHSFEIPIVTSGASPDDRYVNRAHARAENTVLVMRTSSAFSIESAPVPPATELAGTGWDLPAGLVAVVGATGLVMLGLVLAVTSRRRRG